MTDTQQDYRPVAQTAQTGTTAQLLKVLTPEIQRALPKGMDADRIARLVLTEIRKNPKLAECTQQSFAGALLTASALGLEPGVNGECYLVPYKDNKRRVVDCQLIVGYQGIVKLFWQHPLADYVAAEWVGSNDTFRYVKGLNPILEHTEAKGDRGVPVFYYAIVRAKGRQAQWNVFSPEEIQKLRRGKVGPSGDIPDPQHWMERKTALKQVLKLAPKSTRLDMAIKADEASGAELSRSMDIPAIAESPEYIDGEFEDQHAVEPTREHPEVEMVTEPQTTKLAIIRDERYPKTAKGRADWFKWVATVINREVHSNTKLTKAEASVLIDVLEPESAPTEGN